MSTHETGDRRPHVVIVGGGFGGLAAARVLRARPVRVTLLDRHNYHLFQPLLYQVATAALSPGDIASPIRAIVRNQPNTRVLLGAVRAVDVTARRLKLEDGELHYDYLILAPGASHTYFGHDEWAALAPGLKTIEDALDIRRRVFLAYEAAERATDEAMRRALLTFVVVGGGPTGVELAGALAEIARHSLARDFRTIDPTSARVILAEAGPRILSTFPESLSAAAVRSLEELGVEVRTGSAVTDITSEAVTFGEERVPTHTVLWAAGVKAAPVVATLGAPQDRAGRVLVMPDLSIPEHPNVFVVGDAAAFLHQGGALLPGTAPVAMQQGAAAARAIIADLAGRPRTPFHYQHKGNLATIGRAAGVADFGRVRLRGFLAWIAWLFIHIYFLIGFDNRLMVLFQWAWSYLTYQRGVRLITYAGPPQVAAPPLNDGAGGEHRDH